MKLSSKLFLLFAVAGLSAGCEFVSAPQSWLAPEGPVAAAQGGLFLLSLWLMTGIFVVVTALLIYAVWRYRDRGDGKMPLQYPGNRTFELVWTLIPTLLIIFLAVPTVRIAFETAQLPDVDDALEIHVTGYQFWWEFEYPEQGIVTANELHIPVDRVVNFTLNSADVIHSFWFPRLAGKRDVNPGGETNVWLVAERPGLFLGQCAEFCGISHANMRLRLTAHSEADFEHWVARMQEAGARTPDTPVVAPGTPVPRMENPALREETPGGEGPPEGATREQLERGRTLFATGACAACHTLADAGAFGRIGPNLDNYGMRETLAAGIFENTPENLRRWILTPQEMKPGVSMPGLPLSDEDVDALTAYLLSQR